MSIVKNFQSAQTSGGGIQSIAVTDTDSVDLTATGTDDVTISADVKISATAGNIAQINPDGLYVPASEVDGVQSVAVTDSSSIDLSLTGTTNVTISGSARISADSGNQLEARDSGLFVPLPVFSQNIKIDFYDTPGIMSWAKPSGSVMHDIFMIGGGGGGAAGFVRYSGNNGGGGGGGAPGCIIQFRCLTQYLASTVAGFVGDGGSGGVGNLVGVTQNPGSNGQDTTFGPITALGGIGGPISSDAPGRTNGCILFESTFNSGGGGAVSGTNGAAPSQLQRIAPTGGGSGGGAIDSFFGIGGNGGAFLTFSLIGYPTVGVLGGQTIGSPGSPGITLGMIGTGGGGGAGVNDVSADGGVGGAGGLYGGGGGGGGGATAIWLGDMTRRAGNGGKGGRGCIMVISYIE